MGNDDRDCLWDFEESDLPLEAVEGEDVLADRLSLDAVPDVLEMPAEKRGLNNGLPNVPLSPRKKTSYNVKAILKSKLLYSKITLHNFKNINIISSNANTIKATN